MKPRRIDAATRTSLALLSQLRDWRSCLVASLAETSAEPGPLCCAKTRSRQRGLQRIFVMQPAQH